MLRLRALAALVLALAAACTGVEPGFDVQAGPDATMDDGAPDDRTMGEGGPEDVPGAECRSDHDCDDGRFCDGVERCLEGRCALGVDPCDDHHSCTADACNEAAASCTHAPDDSMCGDHDACDGVERCNPASLGASAITGCEPVRPNNLIDCNDANNCTLDLCDATVGCVHAPRDLDGDGHVDRMCTVDGTPAGAQGDDCNDGDPLVYAGAPEVCDNGRDDNCDGLVDLADPTCLPSNDTCASAMDLPGPGTYWGSVVNLHYDYRLACNPSMNADAVFRFTLAATSDVAVAMTPGGSPGGLALLDTCAPLDALQCNRGTTALPPSLYLHSLAPGTYYLVAADRGPSPFRLSLGITAPTPQPVEDACPASGADPAVELVSGVPQVARLATLEDDYDLSCSASGRRDAVYRVTLPAPSDVALRATAPTGTTVVALRSDPCASAPSELRCASVVSPNVSSVSQGPLPAGTYWAFVENSVDADVTVTATVAPPAARPLGDACPATDAGPAVELNDGAPHIVHLAALADDYTLSCDGGSMLTDGVLRLTLAAPSDVAVHATGPAAGTAYLSFRGAPCALATSELRCASGGYATGATVSQAALPAGTYWVVVEHSNNADVTVAASVTTPPA